MFDCKQYYRLPFGIHMFYCKHYYRVPFGIHTSHRLSRNMKLRLYNLCVCSTLTHSCEAWNLTKAVSRILNGFNSRCLHMITGEVYRDTAISPAYNLLLPVRQRRLRYLGHLYEALLISVSRVLYWSGRPPFRSLRPPL